MFNEGLFQFVKINKKNIFVGKIKSKFHRHLLKFATSYKGYYYYQVKNNNDNILKMFR